MGSCSFSFCRTAFSSSEIQVSEQSGVDINGQDIHYIKYSVPVLGDAGEVKYLAEINIKEVFKQLITEVCTFRPNVCVFFVSEIAFRAESH